LALRSLLIPASVTGELYAFPFIAAFGVSRLAIRKSFPQLFIAIELQ
jgi:hypothetical protein